MKFLLDNLILVAIALASGGLLLWPLIRRGTGASALTPLQATQLINHRNAIIVDVRDEKDFALGSLAGARNIPFANLADRAAELVRFKARPVVIVCAAGQQSTRAIETFRAQGFDDAHSLAGGIGAWKEAGLPLVQAGRDANRAAGRDPQRKVKGDGRSNSGKGQRRNPAVTASATAVAVAPVLEAPVEPNTPAGNDPTANPVATDADASGRVKELS